MHRPECLFKGVCLYELLGGLVEPSKRASERLVVVGITHESPVGHVFCDCAAVTTHLRLRLPDITVQWLRASGVMRRWRQVDTCRLSACMLLSDDCV